MEINSHHVHHRLTKMHPFVNGNSRHASLVADLMILYAERTEFSWGGRKPLDAEGKTRKKYLTALQKADDGRYSDLIKFATAK